MCVLLFASSLPRLSSPPSTHTQMGYDALFFARNDYDDKNQWLKGNTMEFIWRASMSLGDESDIFTGIFLFHYGPPPGFCFDVSAPTLPFRYICIIVYVIILHYYTTNQCVDCA